jgi:hypothetical protein
MRRFKLLLCSLIALLCVSTGQAQGLLRKLKDKAESAVDKATDKAIDKKTDEAIYGKDGNPNNNGGGSSGSGGSSTGGRNNPSNKGGGGLISTPPDVAENLNTADAAFKKASYGETRYAIQQAMLGVELQIGQNILKGLPETVAGLKKVAEEDQVTSTGWGWAGLTIQREWQEGDKQLRFAISNNAAWMQAINLYFNQVGYAQQTGGEQNWKQTKLKGYRAVIEYSDGSGYKLSVPLGQTSLLVFEGVNFATEQEMMNAANQIDIENIKKSLGETN